MNCLVYIPNSLNSPELEILLSTAQELIEKKKRVYILVCRGGKNYYCSKNIYSQKAICFACKSKLVRSLKNLNGNFEIINTPNIKHKFEYKKKLNIHNLFKYRYKFSDNGLSAYASYVNSTRDRDLDGKLAQKSISNLIKTSNALTDFFKSIIIKKKINDIYMFNGRMNNYRPLLRVGNKLKITMHNLEHHGSKDRVFDNEGFLPIDHEYIAKKIQNFWKKYKSRYSNQINYYFKVWMNNQNKFHKSFLNQKQKKNLLPTNWNKKKKNIVFFASSDDENLTGGPKYFIQIYKDQHDIIFNLNNICKKNKNINFWIRLHPRMKDLKWKCFDKIKKLKLEIPDLNIVEPDSLVSSHAMIKNSDLVITPTSSLSIDANFLGKPVINFVNHPFSFLNKDAIPKNVNKLEQIILGRNKYNKDLSAKKIYFYYLFGGKKMKYLSGKIFKEYKFKKKILKFLLIENILYFMGKIFEKYFFNNYNFYLRKK